MDANDIDDRCPACGIRSMLPRKTAGGSIVVVCTNCAMCGV